MAGHAETGGRKSRRVDEDAMYEIFRKKFTREKIDLILDKLLTLGERGDLAAIKLMLEYLMGKPVDKKEISGRRQPIDDTSDIRRPRGWRCLICPS